MKIIDKILTLAVYGLLFYAAVGFMIFSPSEFKTSEIITVACFLAAIIISLNKIVYYKHTVAENEKTFTAIIPYAYFFMINMSGYSGVNLAGERCGLSYMLFKNHQKLGFLSFAFLFLVLWTLIACKTKFALKRFSLVDNITETTEKGITALVALYVPLLMLIDLVYYLVVGKDPDELTAAIITAPYYYWIGYLIFKLRAFTLK